MTKDEWLNCGNPEPMLSFVRERTSERKLRLFLCACCRLIWNQLPQESREAVEIVERYVDQLAATMEFNAANGIADNVCLWTDQMVQSTLGDDWLEECWDVDPDVAGELPESDSHQQALQVDRAAHLAKATTFEPVTFGERDAPFCYLPPVQADEDEERVSRAMLLRDIIGPSPFRSVVLDPAWTAWNDGAVGRMAHVIYRERNFGDMPLLGDALEESGCSDKEILDHCRGPGPHTRGCWVLDLILGESSVPRISSPTGLQESAQKKKRTTRKARAEWLTGTDPAKMLELLGKKVSERKMRLFAVACCRRIWDLIAYDLSREAVEVAERFADGDASVDDLRIAADAALDFHGRAYTARPVDAAAFAANYTAAIDVRRYVQLVASYAAYARAENDSPGGDIFRKDDPAHNPALASEQAWQVSLLHDLIGNPFRAVKIHKSWRTPEVVRMAGEMYDGRGFDQMAGLADVLEQAGCHQADILNHCRTPGPHFRGCWCLDLILGKE